MGMEVIKAAAATEVTVVEATAVGKVNQLHTCHSHLFDDFDRLWWWVRRSKRWLLNNSLRYMHLILL